MLEEAFDADDIAPFAAQLRHAIEQEAAQTEALDMLLNRLRRRFKAPVIDPDGFADWLAPLMLVALLAGMSDVQQEARGGGADAANAAMAPGSVAASPPLAVAAAPITFEGQVFVRPEEAIEWFRAKGIVTPDEFYALDSAARARAFSISGLTDQYALDTVHDSIGKGIAEGDTTTGWLNRLDETFENADLSTEGIKLHHWRLVFEQNATAALNAGRYVQMQRVADSRPYWQAFNPNPVTEICIEIAGKTFRADDPIWGSHYPPNHFGCKTMVVTLDQDELEAEGLDVSTGGDVGEPVPESFAFDPAEAFFLNKGPAGLAPMPEGQAALEALS